MGIPYSYSSKKNNSCLPIPPIQITPFFSITPTQVTPSNLFPHTRTQLLRSIFFCTSSSYIFSYFSCTSRSFFSYTSNSYFPIPPTQLFPYTSKSIFPFSPTQVDLIFLFPSQITPISSTSYSSKTSNHVFFFSLNK